MTQVQYFLLELVWIQAWLPVAVRKIGLHSSQEQILFSGRAERAAEIKPNRDQVGDPQQDTAGTESL